MGYVTAGRVKQTTNMLCLHECWCSGMLPFTKPVLALYSLRVTVQGQPVCSAPGVGGPFSRHHGPVTLAVVRAQTGDLLMRRSLPSHSAPRQWSPQPAPIGSSCPCLFCMLACSVLFRQLTKPNLQSINSECHSREVLVSFFSFSLTLIYLDGVFLSPQMYPVQQREH